MLSKYIRDLFSENIFCLEILCTTRCAYLPLRSDNPVVPPQLREANVESLLAALALYRTAAFDRPSSHALRGRRIRAYD